MPVKKDNKIIKNKQVVFNEVISKDDIISSSESGQGSESENSDDEYEDIDDDEEDDKLEINEDEEEEDDEDELDDIKKKDEKIDDVDEDIDEDCVYRFTKNIDDSDDEIDDIDDFFDDDREILVKDIFVPDDERITKPVLTKYERVRLLQERTAQLALGAKPMLKGILNIGNSKNPMDPKEIAKNELINKMIPLFIIRTLPTGKKEKWKLDELAILN